MDSDGGAYNNVIREQFRQSLACAMLTATTTTVFISCKSRLAFFALLSDNFVFSFHDIL